MIDFRIGIVGILGKWLMEVLVDVVEVSIGFCLVVDMVQVQLDMVIGQLCFEGQDLSQLDGLIVKKISVEYSFNILDWLELLRLVEYVGVWVFSGVENMLWLVNWFSCIVILCSVDIFMFDILVMESVEVVMVVVQCFGSVVFKLLFFIKVCGMCVIEYSEDVVVVCSEVSVFQQYNLMMYIQCKFNLFGCDLGMVFFGGNYFGIYVWVL